jgi:hypothetical protein
MDDGLSWLLILSLYDLRGSEGDWLRFERSAHPRGFRLVPLDRQEVALNEVFDVPSLSEGPVWAEVDVPLRPAGRLLSLLYKVNPLYIESVETGRSYRVLPSVMRAGFLISPRVQTTEEFELMARREYTRMQPVRSVRFECHGRTRPLYGPIQIKFYRLEFTENSAAMTEG